ncbi:carbohydrate ABC transporter substrate-binding protein [Salipaludibacillus agaradhaerens]|uniref:Carbohydrate ABC transporter substrate-binding protein n=1 Tax=Salipaludibacillus agaradhaerens TaxID=76935 RepID=A0A9Q4AY67_SALAG|nr:ABC transporter substrate-binding protein [Salipaludibacillus agaradhaerens]MCR6094944.1 carbohydrate ABC transporter substrate-binding protein [Salipaludibacillus agaradhaerens]MCR6115498.1 carbohydrate ABC transporter substrate-binding protein [Salipaludibacillus agaradhaerens]
MKKLVIAALSSVFLLSACGGNNANDASGDLEEQTVVGDDIEGATELTFWNFQELHTQFFEDAVIRWNEENPDRPIQLIAETYPYDQMHNNLLLALQSGSGAPDIADIEISQFANYLQGEVQLEALNDVVEPELDDLITSRFDIYAKDGNYYGIDYHVGATVMFYNEEIMNEAGVDIDSIETWDDYVEAGEQVVANTDAVMTTVESDDHFTFWCLISQRGSDYFDENGDVILDNETNVDTLQFIYDLVYEHEIAEIAPGGYHHAEEYYGFMNDGGAASLMMPMWYMGRFLDYMEDLDGKMQIRPLPMWEEGGNRSAGMGGTGTVVTNQTENSELAKDFLAFAKLSEEGNVKLWEILGFDPPRHDVWDSPAMAEDNRFYQYFHDDIFEILHDIRDEINNLNITEQTTNAQQEINSNVMHSVLRDQSRTSQEALEDAADAIRSRMIE